MLAINNGAWLGEEIFAIDGSSIAHAAGVPVERIKLNLLFTGGRFSCGARAEQATKRWMR